MITEQEIQQFSEMGAVTIDTPLTQQQLSSASTVFDRLLPFSKPEAGEDRATGSAQRAPSMIQNCWTSSSIHFLRM